MPDANVLIQIASHGGSRRQEAQVRAPSVVLFALEKWLLTFVLYLYTARQMSFVKLTTLRTHYYIYSRLAKMYLVRSKLSSRFIEKLTILIFFRPCFFTVLI